MTNRPIKFACTLQKIFFEMNKQNEAKAQLSRAFACKGDSMEERLYKKNFALQQL